MPFRVQFQLAISGLLSVLLVACQSSSTPSSQEIGSKLSTQPANSAEPIPTSKLSPDLSNQVDELINKTLTENGPGVAVLILRDNQILYAKGYGFANIQQQQSIKATTNFDLASVSKQVTAMCILKLVQTGKIDLAAPIKQYLPEWQDQRQPITVAHLLHHTSGLADYSSEDWEGTDQEFSQLDLEKHFTWLSQQSPRRAPGKKFEYNNSGYALLALIVQRVSGTPFWQFAEDEIFSPLGMSKTQILHQVNQNIPNTALGYKVSDSGKIKQVSLPSVIQGDGNVFSSIADLARYDIALRTNRLISAELKEEAFSPGQLDNGEAIQDEGESYGLGWYITPNYVHHSGSWAGTSTYYRHYLKQPVTIILLSNDENYEVSGVADQIAETLKL